MVRIQDMTNPVLMASTTAMFLLRRLVGINTPHIRVLQDNHTYQEFEIGRVPSRLSLRFERAQHQIPAMYGYLVIR